MQYNVYYHEAFKSTKRTTYNYSGKSTVSPEIVDIMRNLPDRRYNDEADLALGLEQQQQQQQQQQE